MPLRHVVFGNRTEFDADTHAVPLSIIGTCAMRGVNPPEYMIVQAMRQSGRAAPALNRS